MTRLELDDELAMGPVSMISQAEVNECKHPHGI